VVVEGERDLGAVGQVGGDVVLGELDLAVLHVFGMDEEDVLQDAQLLEQGGAHQPVKIRTGHQTVRAMQREARKGVHVYPSATGYEA
jgi:hypothetical protein